MTKAQKAERVVIEQKRYNGWKNYESWAVALWIDNEEPSYNRARMEARQALTEAREKHEEHAGCGLEADATICPAHHAVWRTPAGSLADVLQEMTEESMPDLGASLASDLLNAALSEVDWYEVAEHYLGDLE